MRARREQESAFYHEVARGIAALRRRLGLTQQAMAEAVGIDPAHLSRVERGCKDCSTRVYLLIQRAYNFPLTLPVLGEMSADERCREP